MTRIVPERYRQTDRQLVRRTTYCGITALCVASRDKNALPNSDHPIIIVNPGFRLSSTSSRWTDGIPFFFGLINAIFHFWRLLLPEKFSVCPKNNGFALDSGRLYGYTGSSPPPSGSYFYENAEILHSTLSISIFYVAHDEWLTSL